MSYDYNLGEDFPGQFPSNPSPPPPYAFPQYPDFFHFLSTPLGSFDPALFTAGPKDPSPSTECEEGTVPATQMPACPYAPTAVPASALPLRASDDVDYAPSRPPARRSHRIVPPQKRVLNKQCCPFCSKWILKPCQFTIHLRFHTGEKPFPCSVAGCDIAFPTKSNLTRHLKKIHPGSPLPPAPARSRA